MRSKAILRAAAEELSSRHANVSYFASYKISMFSALSETFEEDLMHVKREMAGRIVSLFRETSA